MSIREVGMGGVDCDEMVLNHSPMFAIINYIRTQQRQERGREAYGVLQSLTDNRQWMMMMIINHLTRVPIIWIVILLHQSVSFPKITN